VKRLFACLLAALILAGFGVPVASAAPAPPKVVIVVGPVGPGMTDRFRAQADEAARAARRYTPDVVKVYSPNATWPAVREALQGASVVVYMGHGNGWPSRYRDSLYPPTQNGFGLNPVAGGGDSQHQYFGEEAVGSQVKLARNAVVLLHHLCYASGNTEPGLPEGTLAQAKLRVDNYAAGFIRAGASAVIAEAWSSPAYNVRSVLAGGRSIEQIWRNAPSANGNFLAFPSDRSPGFVAQMDPDRGTSGFHRSMVIRKGLASRDVLAGGRGSGSTAAVEPDFPSLASTGIALGEPAFRGLTTAGAETALALPYRIKNRKRLPESIQASVRWDPIDVAPVPLDPASEEPTPDPEPGDAAEPVEAETPDPEPATDEPAEPGPPGDPEASPEPAVSGSVAGATGRKAAPRRSQPLPVPAHEPLLPPLPPDGYALIRPEQLGEVVEPVGADIRKKRILVPVELPLAPGLYRLSVTLHDADGVAYDAETQALVPSQMVRIVGEIDARVLAASEATLEAGSVVPLSVKVANLGRAAWGSAGLGDASSPDGGIPDARARVIGHWVSLTAGSSSTTVPVGADLPAGLAGGATTDATLALVVPGGPGEYLLVLDVVTPDDGSLAALGVPPTIVRVTVIAAD